MQKTKVYYLGPEGTFSYKAAMLADIKHAELHATTDLGELAELVSTDENHFAIFPLENSSSCNVHESFDLILEKDLKINQEIYLPINFKLINRSAADKKAVKTVFAHAMAIKQCKKFIDSHSFKLIHTNSNVSAYSDALEVKDAAAIVPVSFTVQDSQTIEENIADSNNNSTRFVVVSKKDKQLAKEIKKVTYTIKLKHKVGSLSELLNALSAINVNLTKIESRAIAGTDWEYLFWIDLNVFSAEVGEINAVIEKNTLSSKLLGLY